MFMNPGQLRRLLKPTFPNRGIQSPFQLFIAPTALQTLQGEHTIDPYGFAEFWVDEASLKQLVADIWFQ